jgi:retinol-binding protein 3
MIPKKICSLFLMLLVGAVCGLAQVNVPGTPAGHTLQAWLDAFNSGDRAKIETYTKTVDQSQSVDEMISFRNQTGGFDLLSIEGSEPLHIRFRVKEKGGPTTALGNLLVKDGKLRRWQPSACALCPQELCWKM